MPTGLATELGVPIAEGKRATLDSFAGCWALPQAKALFGKSPNVAAHFASCACQSQNREALDIPFIPSSNFLCKKWLEEESFEESALCAATESMLVVPIYRGRKAADKAQDWEEPISAAIYAAALQAMIEEWPCAGSAF